MSLSEHPENKSLIKKHQKTRKLKWVNGLSGNIVFNINIYAVDTTLFQICSGMLLQSSNEREECQVFKFYCIKKCIFLLNVFVASLIFHVTNLLNKQLRFTFISEQYNVWYVEKVHTYTTLCFNDPLDTTILIVL